MTPKTRLTIALTILAAVIASGAILQQVGYEVYAPSPDDNPNSTRLQIGLGVSAFQNTVFAAMIAVALDSIVYFGSSVLSSSLRSPGVFKDRFRKGALVVLLISALDIAGFNVAFLNETIGPDWRIFYIVPMSLIVFFLCEGLVSANKGPCNLSILPRTSLRQRLSESMKPIDEVSARTNLLTLIIIQSILPTAVLLVPLLVASGRILAPATVVLAGVFFIWGPGSFSLGILAGGAVGWARSLVYLSISTIAVTILGAIVGMALAASDAVPSTSGYLLLASLVVIWIAYTNMPGFETPKRGWNADDILIEWMYMLFVPAILVTSSFLHFATSSIGTALGLSTLTLFTIILYYLPQAWIRFCQTHDLV